MRMVPPSPSRRISSASSTRSFVDEFDVIGKQRDDPFEHGEMKRVVNNFLQMIDNHSSESIIICATNHQHLLDPALWRRFDDIILSSSMRISLAYRCTPVTRCVKNFPFTIIFFNFVSSRDKSYR